MLAIGCWVGTLLNTCSRLYLYGNCREVRKPRAITRRVSLEKIKTRPKCIGNRNYNFEVLENNEIGISVYFFHSSFHNRGVLGASKFFIARGKYVHYYTGILKTKIFNYTSDVLKVIVCRRRRRRVVYGYSSNSVYRFKCLEIFRRVGPGEPSDHPARLVALLPSTDTDAFSIPFPL